MVFVVVVVVVVVDSPSLILTSSIEFEAWLTAINNKIIKYFTEQQSENQVLIYEYET